MPICIGKSSMQLVSNLQKIDLLRNLLNWKQFSKAFLNATPNCIAVTDLEFKTIISNKFAKTYLDIFQGTLIASTIPELEKESFSVAKKKKPIKNLEIIRNKRHFLTTLSPINWEGSFLGILYIFQNTTELEKTSKKLKSFQQLSIELNTIIDSSNDGLFICDGKGKIVRINPASEKMNGFLLSEIIGKNVKELVKKGLIDQSATIKVIKSKRKESIIQHCKKTGKKLLLTATPVFDKQKRLFRVVTNERDITEIETLKQIINEKQALKNEIEDDLLAMQLEAFKSKTIIAKSQIFKNIVKKALKIARVDANVIIFGESGTGKDVIAEVIHYYSKQRDKPMIKLNCGAIPDSLVESELFGYKKGAFTGAEKDKPGRFEMADNGILFLDEISELPLSSQVKLLRFLEDGHISRIGETTSKKIKVRIIAATNQDLEKMVTAKTFRKDLYYRLKVIPLYLPSLRNRQECIMPLILHYLKYFSKKYQIKGTLSLTDNTSEALEKYTYPGNIRELINMCERLVVMNENSKISRKDLPLSVMESINKNNLSMDSNHKRLSWREMIESFEKQLLKRAMDEHRTQSKAAKILGINQSTIARKLKKFTL